MSLWIIKTSVNVPDKPIKGNTHPDQQPLGLTDLL